MITLQAQITDNWAVICACKATRIFYIDPFIASVSEMSIAFKNWKQFMSSRPT